MSEKASGRPSRRLFLRALGGTAVASGFAGCAGDGDEEPTGDAGGNGGGNGDGTDGDGPSDDEQRDAPESPTPTDSATASPTATEAGSTGSVTIDAHLEVRGSDSNVEQFETLQTTFEAIELHPPDGEPVRMADAEANYELTSIEPGEPQHLFRTGIPPGSYSDGSLFLPIQDAALSDGSDPEFERTVPASGELTFGDPLEFEAGETIELTAIVALLRIAGDGPWTYTVGWGTSRNG